MHARALAYARSCTCPFLGTISESLVSWIVRHWHLEGRAVLCHIDLFESS
jgi:hypothetical protein